MSVRLYYLVVLSMLRLAYALLVMIVALRGAHLIGPRATVRAMLWVDSLKRSALGLRPSR